MTHAIKSKIYNVLLLTTSLFGFLEWGAGNHRFLFQAEAEIFVKMMADPSNGLHPFIILPFAGQLLLLITLFQKNPNKKMSLIGMSCLGILLLLLFLIGCMGLNSRVISASIPYLAVSVLTILHHRRRVATTQE